MMKIDFVSDVVCPWCAIGLASFERALERLQGEVQAELHFQPFELNPQMSPEGEDIVEHLSRKYGITPEQIAANHEAIRQRGEAVGFTFGPGRHRIVNTFDAHRLLHWAGLQGPVQQRDLKHALLRAYFTDGHDPSDPVLLARIVGEVGLDVDRAEAILASNEFADDVRQRQQFYRELGIHAVPSIILNDQHLIQGGQPVEVFEKMLRQVRGHVQTQG